jgi:hypothetical protein
MDERPDSTPASENGSDRTDHDQSGSELERHLDARVARVHDYLSEALARPDPLRATLGSVSCGLMMSALRLEKIIEQVANSEQPPITIVPKVVSAINVQTRVARQIDRLADRDSRFASADPTSEDSGQSGTGGDSS